MFSGLVLASEDHRLQETPCVLGMDAFHYFVELCLSMPTLYAEDDSALTRIPTGGLIDLHALQLVFTAHLTQIMLTADLEGHGKIQLWSSITWTACSLFINICLEKAYLC